MQSSRLQINHPIFSVKSPLSPVGFSSLPNHLYFHHYIPNNDVFPYNIPQTPYGTIKERPIIAKKEISVPFSKTEESSRSKVRLH